MRPPEVGMVAKDPLSALVQVTPASNTFGRADLEPGNKCGKCQNHNLDISKKGKCARLARSARSAG